jgi:hypothetical protein
VSSRRHACRPPRHLQEHAVFDTLKIMCPFTCPYTAPRSMRSACSDGVAMATSQDIFCKLEWFPKSPADSVSKAIMCRSRGSCNLTDDYEGYCVCTVGYLPRKNADHEVIILLSRRPLSSARQLDISFEIVEAKPLSTSCPP